MVTEQTTRNTPPTWRQVRSRADVGMGARLLYGLLEENMGEDGTCSIIEDEIAKQLGVQGRQVRNYINDLKAAGLLFVRSRGRAGANIYSFAPIDHPPSRRQGRAANVVE